MARHHRSALSTVLLVLVASHLAFNMQPVQGRIILVQTGDDASNDLAALEAASLQPNEENTAAIAELPDADAALSPIYLAWLSDVNNNADNEETQAPPSSAHRLLRRSARRTKPRRKSHRKRSDRTGGDQPQVLAWYNYPRYLLSHILKPSSEKRDGSATTEHSSSGGGSNDKRPQFRSTSLCSFKICTMGKRSVRSIAPPPVSIEISNVPDNDE